MGILSEQAVQYRVPTDDKWVFVRNREGRVTNVRVMRGTTIIEVLHKGEKILVDIAAIEAGAELVQSRDRV